jgi:antitoxin MazE
MKATVTRLGNSLGLWIPNALATEAGIDEGSEVDLSIKNGELVVRPLRRTKLTLKALLARVTEENKHEEIDFGRPVGKEIC